MIFLGMVGNRKHCQCTVYEKHFLCLTDWSFFFTFLHSGHFEWLVVRSQGKSSFHSSDGPYHLLRTSSRTYMWWNHLSTTRHGKPMYVFQLFNENSQIDPRLPTPSPAQQQAKHVESSRHQMQEQHEAEYQQALITIKESVRLVDGPDIKETLQDQIRQWFLECR